MPTLPDPNLIILYVENVSASAAFYADLLCRPPVESSPTFAMFALSPGLMLGLWVRTGVEPAAKVSGGGGEICFKVANVDAIHAVHAEWRARGLTVIQSPTKMDFGHTFVASDPDGHRLRVYFPTEQ